MKRIFISLLTLAVVGLLSVEKSFAQLIPTQNLRVRYAVELKEVSKAEAESYLKSNGGVGYVELASYIYFSKEWKDAGYITESGSTARITNLRLGSNTQSYKMIDANGNDYSVGDVATFAPDATFTKCGNNIFQPAGDVVSFQWNTNGGILSGRCPSWAYSGISDAGSINNTIVEKITYNGETWYRMEQFPIRFIYTKAESFYATFVSTPIGGLDNGMCDGGLNFNIQQNSPRQTIVWKNWNSCSNEDWSYAKYNWSSGDPYNPCAKDLDAFDLVPGGLKIISDPEMLLTAEATCGGTDLPGKLSVNDWAGGKTWADYSGVKFYVNKTGGSVSGRKQVSAGDLTATIPTTGTAAEIAYTLTPEGYTMPDGSYADSLIWVIEDTFLA
ncbi:hypothetical protein HDR68_01635 [bacterium]|nr:hypothetical protein [bacterium]